MVLTYSVTLMASLNIAIFSLFSVDWLLHMSFLLVESIYNSKRQKIEETEGIASVKVPL